MHVNIDPNLVSLLKILKIFLLFYLFSWSIAYLFFQQSICRFPEELRSTHFIAIRITDPDIIRTAKSIQENIVSKEEALNDCCMGIGKKHALKIYDQFVLLVTFEDIILLIQKFQEIAHLRSIFFFAIANINSVK